MSSSVLCAILIITLFIAVSDCTIHIEHNSKSIGEIDARWLEDDLLDVAVLFDLIQMLLQKHYYFILSEHFHLEYNGRIITRHSPNLDALMNMNSEHEIRINVLYPEYAILCQKTITTFQATAQMELEFDFQLFPYQYMNAMGKYPLPFLQTESMRLTIWIESWRTLEIVYFYTGSGVKRQRWESLLKINVTNPFAEDRMFDSLKPLFGHFYIRIWNGASKRMIKVSVNEETKVSETPNLILRNGESVRILISEAVQVVKGYIQNLIVHAS